MAGPDPKDFGRRGGPGQQSAGGSAPDPRSFVTGQNLQATPGSQAPNGWDTPFMQRFQTQYQQAVDAGTAPTYFAEKKDGIALWDDQSGKNEYKFGDVFSGGKRVGNIYDQYGAAAADQMMKPLIMSATEQTQGQTVADKRATMNRDIKAATTRAAYDQQVQQTKESWGDTSAIAAGGGALGTGLIGAGIGSFLGPVGTAVGFGIGAAIGGTAAWLNRDELTDMAARGEVQAELAGQGGNAVAAGTARLQSWAQLAGKSMSPLSNFVHGSWDATAGSLGDNKVSFYDVDKSGQPNRPGWLTATDLVASLGDSALQFASPAGRLGFQGYMGGTVAGKTGGMVATGGETFDERSGTYDNVFTDEQGNFDPLSSAAGLTDVGIDAVQMLGGGAMGKVSQAFTRGEGSKLSEWGRTAAGAEARATRAAGRPEEYAGIRFTRDADGNIDKARVSALSMFAPSEAIQYLGARGSAMLAHGRKAGPVSPQELYVAAKRLSNGSTLWKSALVNGFGEGTEEAVQAVAEAVSHNQAPDLGDVATSAMYGFASGAGMSVGARMFGKSAADRQFNQARLLHGLRNNGQELSRDTWEMMSPDQQVALASVDEESLNRLTELANDEAKKMKMSATRSTADINRVVDAVRQQEVLERSTLNDALDGNYLVSQAGYDIDDHMMVGSVEGVTNLLSNAMAGLAEQRQGENDPTMNARLGATAAALEPIVRMHEQASDLFYNEATPAPVKRLLVDTLNQLMQAGYEINPTPQHWARLDGRLSSLRAELAKAPEALRPQLSQWMDQARAWERERITQGPLTPQSAFTARALTLIMHRDPADNAGSFPGLLPQIGFDQSEKRINQALQLTHNVLQPLNADFDGDRLNQRARIVMDDDLFMRIRTGQYLLGAMQDTRVNVLQRDFTGQNIELTYESAHSSNSTLSSNAEAFYESVENFARATVPFAADLVARLRKGLEAGQEDAFHRFLSSLASDYTSEMQEAASQEARNLYFEMNSFFQRELQKFQTSFAQADVPATEELLQQSKNFRPVSTESTVAQVLGRSAVNWTQRLFNLLPDANMFRKWQQLHYTKRTSSELATPSEIQNTIAEMVRFYEQLSSGDVDSALEELDAKDDITATVMRQLRRLVHSRSAESWGGGAATFPMLANMRVPNLLPDGTLSREPITLTQWLLRKAVDAHEMRNKAVLARKPELTAKYERLREMEPGRAFVEVFKGTNLRALLGQDADVLGANRTVGELFTLYTNQDEYGRKADADAMKSDARYHHSRDLPVLPSDFDMTGNEGVTGYSLVVDAILEAGNKTITWNASHKTGKGVMGRVDGSIGDSSRRAQTAFRKAVRDLQEITRGIPGFKGTAKEYQTLLSENLDVGRAYLETLSTTDVLVNYRIEGGELFVDDWVYELLTKSPEEAEMLFFKKTLISQWRALGVSIDPDKPVGRSPENINDRMLLLMWRLADQERRDPFSQTYTQFKTRLLDPNVKDVDSFFSWVNNEVRQGEPPYTPWNRDIAELDPTSTNGGWSASLESSTRRQTFISFAEKVSSFSKQRARDAEADRVDATLEVRLNEALRNPNPDNQHLVLGLQRSIEFARKFWMPLGPGARNLLLGMSAWGMFTPGHDKAKAPAGFEALGEYLSKAHSMQFSTPEQALLASLTSFAASDAGRQAQMLLQDGWDLMDSQGRPISLDDMTPARYMELYADPKNRPLLNAMMHPAVLELTGDDRVDVRYVTKLRLSDLVTQNTIEDVLFGNSARSKAVNASYVDAIAGNEGLTRYVHEVLIAQTTTASKFTKGLGSEIAKAAGVTEEVVDLLRMMAPHVNTRVMHTNDDGTETEMSALESLKLLYRKERRTKEMRERFGSTGEEAKLAEKVLFNLLQEAKQNLLQELPDNASMEELREYNRRLELLDSVMKTGKLDTTIAAYGKFTTPQDRYRLYTFVWENRDIVRSIPTSRPLRKLISGTQATDAAGLPEMSSGDWEDVAKAVVGYELRRQYEINVPSAPITTIPGKGGDWKLKYWDPEFSYILDGLVDLAPSMLELQQTFGRTQPKHSLSEIARRMTETVLDPKKYGVPTQAMIAQMEQGFGQMFASPSKQGIGRGGLGPQHETTEGMATGRTFVVPEDGLRSTALIGAEDLANWANTDQMRVQRPGSKEFTLEPMWLLRGRFTNEIVVTDVSTGTTYRLDEGPNNPAPTPMLRRVDTRYGAVTPYRLNNALSKLIQSEGLDAENVQVEVKFFHPLDQPDEAEFANNVYFEGVALDEGDSFASLAAAHWFTAGGIDQRASKGALEAAKKSRKALKMMRAFTSADRAALEGNWMNDFGGMLVAKTAAMMNADLGDGDRIDPMFFNAVLKSLKMRHAVRFVDDEGRVQLWSAEQVIWVQRVNGPMPANAELVKLSEAAFRTLLGEQGVQGEPRVYDRAPSIDPTTSIASWTGRFTDEQLGRLPGLVQLDGGEPARGELFEVPEARQGFQHTLVYDGYMSPELASRYEMMRLHRQELASRVGRERMKDIAPYAQAASRALQEAENALVSEAALDEQRQLLGLPSGRRDSVAEDIDRQLIQDINANFNRQRAQTGFVYYATTPRTKIDPLGDKVGYESLENRGEPAGHWIVQDDVVVVQLDSFPMDEDKAQQELRRVLSTLMDRGVVIVLVGDEASSQTLKTYGSRFMRDGGQYRRKPGSQTIFEEQDPSTEPMSKRAMREKLVEVRKLETFNQTLFLETDFGGLQENAGAITKSGMATERLALGNDPVPVSAFAGLGYTMPLPENMDEIRALISESIDDLVIASRNGVWRKAWQKLSKRDQGKAELSLRNALEKAANFLDDSGVYPRDTDFGTGDIIPLYNPSTKKLLLYRHGHTAPTLTEINEMMQDTRVGIYGPTPLPTATTRRGRVIGFETSSQYGLRVKMAMRLSALFDKTAFELEGMKITWVPDSHNLQLPDPVANRSFFGYVGISDMDGKQAVSGRMNHFQGLFSTLGIDFTEDLAKGLFGTKNPTAAQISQVPALLLEFRRRAPRVDLELLNQAMNLRKLPQQFVTYLNLLGKTDQATQFQQKIGEHLAETDTAEAQLTRAVLLYLMSDDAAVEHVLSAPGLNTEKSLLPGQFTREMPLLFTQVFDNPSNKALRKLAIEKLNGQLSKEYDSSGKLVAGTVLLDDLSIKVLTRDGKSISGYLRRSEMHSTGDNPLIREMSEDRKAKQVASQQITSMAALALDARTSTSKEGLAKLSALINRSGFGSVDTGAELLATLSNISGRSAADPMYRQTPAEQRYKDDARILLRGYRVELNTEDWTDEEKRDYSQLRARIAERFHLGVADAVRVDYWVRQRLGRPSSRQRVDGVDPSAISFDDVKQELQAMSQNRDSGQLPTFNSMVPVMMADDLAALFHAAKRQDFSWLRTVLDDPSSTTAIWQDWVHVALAFGEHDNAAWDAAYMIDVDAHMHTYANTGVRFSDLPPSFDPVRSAALLDPETSQLVLSLSPGRREQLRDEQLLSAASTIEDIFGGTRDGLYWRNHQNPVSSVQRQKVRWFRRRRADNIPEPMQKTQRAVMEQGMHFVNEGTQQNAVIRTALNMRAALALLNPMLFFGAPVEAHIQELLERASNIITGDATIGAGGAANGVTAEARTGYRLLYQALGSNAAFKSLVHAEYAMHSVLMNAGPTEAATWRLAKLGGKWQDPYYGMRADAIARRYVESAARFLRSTGQTNVTGEMVARRLSTNPNWLRDQNMAAHQAAMATLLNLKNVKPTVASLAWRGIVDPLSENPRLLPNMFGNLVLKLPFMFAGYTMNKAVQILGLQAWDQAAALFLHGRKNPIFGRMQALMRGTEYNDEDTIDMSHVIETLDLTNAVVKSGLTHTGLFAMGLMAGGLGLSGEDEEDRRRRKAAMYQGFAYLYDPRDIVNDFRNADALYLDWLPFDLDEFFRVTDDENAGAHSMASMNWIVKSVLSPIIGMERFYNTGNPYELMWAFKDAFYSMPLVNTMLFDDAVQVNAELAQAAADAEAVDSQAPAASPSSLPNAFDFLIKGMMNYERMLLESSFINQLYIASDKYDRDAWVLPEKDENGKLVTNRLGIVQGTGALTQRIDPETGEVVQAYKGRDNWDATLHGYTENRGTLALLSNLFTGFSGGYLRNEMAVKTRKITKDTLSIEEAEAEVWGLWKGSKSFESPNMEGVFIPFNQRQELQGRLMARLKQDGVDRGLSEYQADKRMKRLWYGSSDNPTAVALKDIVWSDKISYKQSDKYYQLNTTYVLGPDGNVWATGISRNFLTNLAGIAPLQRYYVGDVGGMGIDSRLNSTDDVRGINTGMRALEKVDESFEIPVEEQSQGYQQAAYTPYQWQNYGGYGGYRRGYGGYGGYRRRRGGGGGGGGGGSTRLYAPQDSIIPYANDIPNISSANPIFRRASIRRERVDSQRGRLKQWQ